MYSGIRITFLPTLSLATVQVLTSAAGTVGAGEVILALDILESGILRDAAVLTVIEGHPDHRPFWRRN